MLYASQEVLRRRVGEHASRLKRQEEGLKTHQESIQRLEVEKVKLGASVARLSKEKRALISRAGVVVGDDGNGASGAVADDPGEDGLRALIREKGDRTAELEAEKERLQARCRELQVRCAEDSIRILLRSLTDLPRLESAEKFSCASMG